MKEEEIDYSEIPAFDEAFLREVEMKVSPGKKPVSLRLDADVLEWIRGSRRLPAKLCP